MLFNGSVMLTTPDQCAVSNKTSRHSITIQKSELKLLIDEKLAVAVIQNIIDDQSCRFKFTQRSGIEKDVF